MVIRLSQRIWDFARLHRFRSMNSFKKGGHNREYHMAIKQLPNIGNNMHYLISGQQTSMDPQGSFFFCFIFVFVFLNPGID